jgi:hypothetical protein
MLGSGMQNLGIRIRDKTSRIRNTGSASMVPEFLMSSGLALKRKRLRSTEKGLVHGDAFLRKLSHI